MLPPSDQNNESPQEGKLERKPWKFYDAWVEYAVPAASVEDFLSRYYKADRYTGRGEEYAAVLLDSCRADYEKFGVCWCSHFDSVNGQVCAFYGPNTKYDTATGAIVPV